MNIIKQAQENLKKYGIDQWQNNYPNIEIITRDIQDQNNYILMIEEKIVGTVVLDFELEQNYECISNGYWLSEDAYAVIHRIAVDNDYKGLKLSSYIIKKIEEICLTKGVHSIRVDTHRDNFIMKQMLQKNGFQYCGVIYLEDESQRIAFEKLIG